MKPILLDTFCCAGGCSRGYQQAGFYVVGIDINPQPHYIGDDFLQMDALEVMRILIGGGYITGRTGRRYWLNDFAVIHASPPCQVYSVTASLSSKTHPDLVGPVRELLQATQKPYVIENVEGAPLINPITLCGTMFGLKTIRHRLFETSPEIYWPPAQCQHIGKRAPNRLVDETGRGVIHSFERVDLLCVVGHNFKVSDGRKALGVDWMTGKEIAQAIPPKYTEWIGQRLMEVLQVAG